MGDTVKDTVIAITAYNHMDYTKRCLDSIKNLKSDFFDVMVIDNSPNEDTKNLCKDYDVTYYKNPPDKHLTYSINRAYQLFKEGDWEYIAIANNDVLIPDGALEELKDALVFIPSSLAAPLSTELGCGHNKQQSISRIFTSIDDSTLTDTNYQQVQNSLIDMKVKLHSENNLYLLDPMRMKMFNGFFFMLNKRVKNRERDDGNIFDPSFKNVKNEDEFNWKQLIPGNDYPLLVKTAFVYHYKGVTCTTDLRF